MEYRDNLRFGAAYYDEYMPCERLEQDMQMMVEAGFNTIRIAESTWSTEEPEPGRFDFSHVDRVLDAAERYGLSVIVGTPTYAVPHWLVQLDPDVLATTKDGRGRYGTRQNMDITNPTYRYYAERIIRKLVSHTAGRACVIGYQIDNETKHYGVAGPQTLVQFRRWLQQRFGSIEALNQAFGLAYWSNSVSRFEDLPDPTGTINGSYGCAFAMFQRSLVAEFLQWQANLVREYLRPDQFITHNFDYEWRSFGAPGQQDGYSRGVQPDVNHYDCAKALTLVGTDIYCHAQDRLTGREIAFGGDSMRPLRRDNYLVLESQAQAFKEWLPYPGQLRLMGWSHVASGALGVMYWNWHSIHNGLESYWKGLLSHDLGPNETYREACRLGAELKRLSPRVAGLRKRCRVALVVSTEALHALRWFPTDKGLSYNDIVHWIYDTLYDMNLECDVLFDQETDWSDYSLLVIPALYTVQPGFQARVRAFVEQGGTVFATFRSFVADENVKISHEPLPWGLTDVFGMHYSQWTAPVHVTVEQAPASWWMELLKPDGAQTVSAYIHRYWSRYAAVTRNAYGRGKAWYLGTMVPETALRRYLADAAQDAGLTVPPEQFPVIVRSGVNRDGNQLHFLLHYSDTPREIPSRWHATDLCTGRRYAPGDSIALGDWDVCILEEDPQTAADKA